LARFRISGLLIITEPGPFSMAFRLIATSWSKASRYFSGTWSLVTVGVRAMVILLNGC
jgi:hypothetical protein